jgi:proline iminopeptidase
MLWLTILDWEQNSMRAKVLGTELFFDTEGSELGFCGTGLAERPTIIVLHGGLGFNHAYLKPGLSPLSTVAQVIFVDLRGQGRSGRPSIETCTLEQMADDVAALCRQIGITSPVIFGHSAGGFVALQMALRHSALVGGLILSGSSPAMAAMAEDTHRPSPSLATRAPAEALATAARVFGGDITEETVAKFFQEVGPYYAGPNHIKLAEKLLELSAPDVVMMRHFMDKLASSYDLRPKLSQIAAPTLLLVGSHDWVCPPRASRYMAISIPQADLVEFQDSGHFLFSEEPERFHAVVSRYLVKIGKIETRSPG